MDVNIWGLHIGTTHKTKRSSFISVAYEQFLTVLWVNEIIIGRLIVSGIFAFFSLTFIAPAGERSECLSPRLFFLPLDGCSQKRAGEMSEVTTGSKFRVARRDGISKVVFLE